MRDRRSCTSPLAGRRATGSRSPFSRRWRRRQPVRPRHLPEASVILVLMVRTVIFDLGKVIIPFDFNRGYRALEEFCGLPAAEVRRRIASTDLVIRLETGLIEPQAFVGRLSGLLGLQIDYAAFCGAWSSIFLPDTLLPDSLLESLHRRYRLLLLSNTNAIH